MHVWLLCICVISLVFALCIEEKNAIKRRKWSKNNQTSYTIYVFIIFSVVFRFFENGFSLHFQRQTEYIACLQTNIYILYACISYNVVHCCFFSSYFFRIILFSFDFFRFSLFRRVLSYL